MAPDEDGRYLRIVRAIKTLIGLLAALTAMVVAAALLRDPNGGLHADWPLVAVLGVFAVLSGMMLDSRGMTEIIGLIVDALPWTPDRPPDQGANNDDDDDDA